MASFSDIAKQRLATYKQDVLGVAEDGLWRKGQPYPHILPSDRKELKSPALPRGFLAEGKVGQDQAPY